MLTPYFVLLLLLNGTTTSVTYDTAKECEAAKTLALTVPFKALVEGAACIEKHIGD